MLMEQIVAKQKRQIEQQSLSQKERAELIELRKAVRRRHPSAVVTSSPDNSEELKELQVKVSTLEAERDELKKVLLDDDAEAYETTRSLFRVISNEVLAPPAGDAKTIGLKVNPGIRVRLEDVKEEYELRSYKQVVMSCMKLGLTQIEKATR